MMVATLVRYDMISSPSLLNVLVYLLNFVIVLVFKGVWFVLLFICYWRGYAEPQHLRLLYICKGK